MNFFFNVRSTDKPTRCRRWRTIGSILGIVFLCLLLVPPSVRSKETSQVENLLKRADFYFEYGWLTSPRHKNAYTLYQRVLKLEPTNQHAAQKVYEISEYYRQRAEALKQEGNDDLAGMYNYRYRKIVEYLLREVWKQQYELEFQRYRELGKIQQKNDTEQEEIIRTLDNMIVILRDMESLYRQLSVEKSDVDKLEEVTTQITQKIQQYEKERARYSPAD